MPIPSPSSRSGRLLACGRSGRRLESAWSNGKRAYRCRHGLTSATSPDSRRPGNTYIREDQILPHLAAIAVLLAGYARTPGRGSCGAAQITGPADTAGLIDQLRADGLVLTYDPDDQTLRRPPGRPAGDHRQITTDTGTRKGGRPAKTGIPAPAAAGGRARVTIPQGEAFGVAGTLLSTSYAGVPFCDVQEAASHAGPRTTMSYDRARGSWTGRWCSDQPHRPAYPPKTSSLPVAGRTGALSHLGCPATATSAARRPYWLSRPGARCRDYSRSVSPGRSPNPPCWSPGSGLSTASAVRRG